MKIRFKTILVSFCIGSIICYSSCNDEPELISEVCFEDSPLLYWYVNDEPQTPGTSIEPNLDINLDFIYAIDKYGSWSINFSNELYTIVFADFDYLIAPQELDNLSESQWEDLIQKRGNYPFEFEAHGRQELTLNSQKSLIFIGDSVEEVAGGEIKISIEKTAACKFLVLEVKAILTYESDTYTVEIGLKDPYLFP